MKQYSLLLSLAFVVLNIHNIHSQVDRTVALSMFTNSVNSQNAEPEISARISSDHVSSTSGVHHFYFQQVYDGISVYRGVGSLHFGPNGQVIQQHQQFLPITSDMVNEKSPKITAIQAIQSAAQKLGYPIKGEIEQIRVASGKERRADYRNQSLNQNEIRTKLMYQLVESKYLRLCWNFDLMDLNSSDWWDLRVDAETGEIIDKNNLTVDCGFEGHHHTCQHSTEEGHKSHAQANNKSTGSMLGGYNVYAMPLISPADGNRTFETDPYDLIASPLGWHDTTSGIGSNFTYTFGNNVHAYEDGDNPGYSPDGGLGLNFNFNIDTVYSIANQSEDAIITNLFYWNNIIHDLMYRYGFDEASGNFQETNYANGGLGGDYVNAEAQDNSGSCNANFGTPSDGGNPRMQMYTCGSRDGDLDNMVIVHEYGHGISNRLTGGPALSGCLINQEQMGEGWSDYFGLMMTMKSTDLGDDPKPVGNWLFEYPQNGPGIREYPYSTDMAVNPHTYDNIKTAGIPHGVGSVWCAMLWEMTWALIDQYGFDSDLATGSGGNNIAMKLVIEGLKLQPCSPGFVDGRDAILLADQMLYGGANQCLIWNAFAKRGLGGSADQGISGSRLDGTEAFDLPKKFVYSKISDKIQAEPGDTITYTLVAANRTELCNDPVMTNVQITDTLTDDRVTYLQGSASHGGSFSNGVVSFPLVASVPEGDSITRSFSVVVDAPFPFGEFKFMDDIESGDGNWTWTSTTATNWVINTTNAFSGTHAWFAEDESSTVDKFLTLDSSFTPGPYSLLVFQHAFNTEGGWDGGVVQYSTTNGATWSDLGPYMIKNGYNSTIDNNPSTPAFSGSSMGYQQTIVDLSSFANMPLSVRFWMSCDQLVGGEGWYIDDVSIISDFVFNQAIFSTDSGTINVAELDQPTLIYYAPCFNGIQDGDETGVDCGGYFCRPCPTCNDGLQNGSETGIDCGGPDCADCPSCVDVVLEIEVDQYPSETTWELFSPTMGEIEAGGPYTGLAQGTIVRDTFCLDQQCGYYFRIFDSFGDGICCSYGEGHYSLFRAEDSLVLVSGGQFTFSEVTPFCVEDLPTNCDSLLMVHGLLESGTYHAGEILQSDARVRPPSVVIFKAEEEIRLDPNFEVELGGELTLTIESCIQALNILRKEKAIIDGNKVKKAQRQE